MEAATKTVTKLVTDESCSNSGPNKVAFLLTIFLVGILWWAGPVVLHIKKGPRTILKAIAWNCSRETQPAAAGFFAIQASRTHEERLLFFYNGTPIHGAEKNKTKMSWTMILFNLGCSLASLVPFILGLVNRFNYCGKSDTATETSKFDARLALQLWYFPSIPGAIIGLWLVLDVKVFRLGRVWSTAICYLFLFLGGALLLAACFVANKRAGNTTSATPLLPTIAYFGMCWYSHTLLSAFYSIFARNLAIALVAFGVPFYPYPWRALEHPVFGAWFLTMGVVCAVLGYWGFAMKDGPKELLRRDTKGYETVEEERKTEREGLGDDAAVGKYQRVSTIELQRV